MKVKMTQIEYDKKLKELNYLKNVKRPQVAQELQTAREFGDLSENAEYEVAKNNQAKNEERILQLESELENAEVIDVSATPKDEVSIGKKVKVLNLNDNTEVVYTIVDSGSIDPATRKISEQSPIGKSLIGSKINDIKKIETPKKEYNIKILEITIDEEYLNSGKEENKGE